MNVKRGKRALEILRERQGLAAGIVRWNKVSLKQLTFFASRRKDLENKAHQKMKKASR